MPLINWGQGVFTSFKMSEGKAIFQDEHILRLKNHYERLFKKNCDFDIMREFDFLLSTKFSGRGRVCLFQNSENEISSLIELRPFNKKDFLKVKTIQEKLANNLDLKLPFYALNFKNVRLVKELGYDDYLNLDSEKNLIESSTSNLLILNESNEVISAFHENALMGIAQKKISEFLKSVGYKVKQRKISVDEAKSSKALFLTNCVQNFVSIKILDEVEFKNDSSVLEFKRIVNEFCESSYGKK